MSLAEAEAELEEEKAAGACAAASQKKGQTKTAKPLKKKQFMNVVICNSSEVLHKAGRGCDDLNKYGLETALMMSKFNSTKNMDLAQEIIRRCEVERDAWLAMSPPQFDPAVKQCLTLEVMQFELGADSHTMALLDEQSDKYIVLSPSNCQENLKKIRQQNREGRSIMPCCAWCGKYQPQKRLLCGHCKIAVYCGPVCQKKHWDDAHRTECGKVLVCACCGKLVHKALTCARCRGPKYCDKAHQLWHWKHGHKSECGST
jgi:hypothetical protein